MYSDGYMKESSKVTNFAFYGEIESSVWFIRRASSCPRLSLLSFSKPSKTIEIYKHYYIIFIWIIFYAVGPKQSRLKLFPLYPRAALGLPLSTSSARFLALKIMKNY